MKQLIHLDVFASFRLANFGPHLVQVNYGFVSKFSHVRLHRFLVISLPAAEKRRSETEVAGIANTRRARRARKGHKFFASHLFHSIRGSSVLGRGLERIFHSVISLSAISSAVTSKVDMALAVAIHEVSSSNGSPVPCATAAPATRSSLMRSMSMLRRTFQPTGS
jgi:hypothetical protein